MTFCSPFLIVLGIDAAIRQAVAVPRCAGVNEYMLAPVQRSAFGVQLSPTASRHL